MECGSEVAYPCWEAFLSARNGWTLKAYGRFCPSPNPYLAASQGQNVVLLAVLMYR